ncbi:MAG TPA: glutathione S-transferase family protein [Rhizomicrobium sp.]|nr:glutathione S-transferase family protein [Rhizomicrobium sp.]
MPANAGIQLANGGERNKNWMGDMLKIWGRRNSANVQKVLWLAAEVGLNYEHIAAGGSFGGLNEPSFRALNPHGRIPVLQDGDLAIWESHAILRYLAARYGDERFWPENPAGRSQSDEWMDWAQTSFQPAFLNGVFRGYYRTPEEQRDWPAIRKSLHACNEQLHLIDRVLSRHPFLGGSSFSLADIPAGTLLYRYFELDIDRPNLANVEAWYARLRERKAYRENVMIPFDELRGKLSF